MRKKNKIKISIDNKDYLGWTEISKKVGISDSLLRARINKLGWSISDAIKPVGKIKKHNKSIFFRGTKYTNQEKFIDSIANESRFSKTTIKIKLAKLNKIKTNKSEKDIEKIVFGNNKFIDNGGYLYQIKSIKSGKEYIGITIRNIKNRWKAHISESNDKTIQSPLKNEIRRYGSKNFKIAVIKKSKNIAILKKLENSEIKKRNTLFPNGLNSNLGGTLGAIDKKTFKFENKEYYSLNDLARERNIKYGTLKQRINNYGMSIKKAVYFNKDNSVEYKGKVFKDLKDFSNFLNLEYSRVISLRNYKYTLPEIVKRLKILNKCPICGNKFMKKNVAHKFCSEKCKWKSRSIKFN